jgi:hypothetical protein
MSGRQFDVIPVGQSPRRLACSPDEAAAQSGFRHAELKFAEQDRSFAASRVQGSGLFGKAIVAQPAGRHAAKRYSLSAGIIRSAVRYSFQVDFVAGMTALVGAMLAHRFHSAEESSTEACMARNVTSPACGCHLTRRGFLSASTCGAVLASELLAGSNLDDLPALRKIRAAGPGSKYTPMLRVAFVRRREEYGILWPGAVYDGASALKNYRTQIETAASDLGIRAEIRPEPIYTPAEADSWIAAAKSPRADGLLLVLLDRQQHAWPTAAKAIDSGIPSIIFAPVGAAFTTNTAPLAKKPGGFIASTDDFSRVVYGMKMAAVAARMREMRFAVIAGKEKKETTVHHLGTRLRYVPAGSFVEEYNRTAVDEEVRQIAADYIKRATRISGPTTQDVLNGVKSYVVARNIMEREEADGITMDCLGALGPTDISLPCIAWSRMLDHGIPAACEADIGAAVTHAAVQFLFDRPGFQQDPVPDTAREALIGAHCTCPTRLSGWGAPAEPFYLSHHHGMRDAVPRPMWKVGQRVTVAIIGGVDPADPAEPHMYISSGAVLDNVAVPPAGGCVVSVTVKLDGVTELLDYPGFHQVFFYGDFKRELRDFCRLTGIDARVL